MVASSLLTGLPSSDPRLLMGCQDGMFADDRHRRKACKAYQNKILFSIIAHPSGASILPTRCTTDTAIETVLYNSRLAAHVRGTLMTTAASASASDPACRRFFYGWVILAACFMVTTVASGTMMGFGVFITPMAEDMGWSHSGHWCWCPHCRFLPPYP